MSLADYFVLSSDFEGLPLTLIEAMSMGITPICTPAGGVVDVIKDGKTYPSICITKEFYPRIFKTRVINKKFGTFYGPYSHISTMYALLDVIKKLYKPRTCRLPLTEEGIRQGKYRPCLDYHIKNCGGACIAKQTHEEYMKN